MLTISRLDELRNLLGNARSGGKTVGFVPTMGALHEGHAALVRKARAENEVVITSIFVNPTQFNNPGDLTHYPRTPEADTHLLESCGCDILFMPLVEEMYPSGLSEPAPRVDLGGLDTVMEGKHRPGHFAGVVQVVKKLFDAVGECRAYFGEKDFQQLAVVRRMTRQLQLPVTVIGCPIVREADGLAMSSRNVRLSAEERAVAPLIAKTLFNAKVLWPAQDAATIEAEVAESIAQEPLMRLEYATVADSETLQPLKPGQTQNAVLCIAVHLGPVRLIDNVVLG
jgi:pantoate--beta-alanine ligase